MDHLKRVLLGRFVNVYIFSKTNLKHNSLFYEKYFQYLIIIMAIINLDV